VEGGQGPQSKKRIQTRTESNVIVNANADMTTKARVLLIGCGGVGTMCAYNLEIGGKAEVTAVLRSNFSVVEREGFSIESIEHGKVEGWRPTESESTNKKICDILLA
jgi:hypothetical protein